MKVGDIDGIIEYLLLLAQAGHKKWNAASIDVRFLIPRSVAQDISKLARFPKSSEQRFKVFYLRVAMISDRFAIGSYKTT